MKRKGNRKQENDRSMKRTCMQRYRKRKDAERKGKLKERVKELGRKGKV